MSAMLDFDRGRRRAQQVIEDGVARGEFPTEKIAARHHFDVAKGALGSDGDPWSQGWMAQCEEVMES